MTIIIFKVSVKRVKYGGTGRGLRRPSVYNEGHACFTAQPGRGVELMKRGDIQMLELKMHELTMCNMQRDTDGVHEAALQRSLTRITHRRLHTRAQISPHNARRENLLVLSPSIEMKASGTMRGLSVHLFE